MRMRRERIRRKRGGERKNEILGGVEGQAGTRGMIMRGE
jgi:hypothetical protein